MIRRLGSLHRQIDVQRSQQPGFTTFKPLSPADDCEQQGHFCQAANTHSQAHPAMVGPIAGHIFGCTNETMEEVMGRRLFGLPGSQWHTVQHVKAGMPLFLYNFSEKVPGPVTLRQLDIAELCRRTLECSTHVSTA